MCGKSPLAVPFALCAFTGCCVRLTGRDRHTLVQPYSSVLISRRYYYVPKAGCGERQSAAAQLLAVYCCSWGVFLFFLLPVHVAFLVRFFFFFVCQLLNLMSGEVKRDLKEDNPKDDALTNTYNALKVRVLRRKVQGAHQVSSLVAAHRKSTGVVVVVGERTRHFRVQ